MLNKHKVQNLADQVSPIAIDQAQSDTSTTIIGIVDVCEVFLHLLLKWAYPILPHHREKLKNSFKQAILPCHILARIKVHGQWDNMQPLLSRQIFLPSQRYSFPSAQRMKPVTWWQAMGQIYNSVLDL